LQPSLFTVPLFCHGKLFLFKKNSNFPFAITMFTEKKAPFLFQLAPEKQSVAAGTSRLNRTNPSIRLCSFHFKPPCFFAFIKKRKMPSVKTPASTPKVSSSIPKSKANRSRPLAAAEANSKTQAASKNRFFIFSARLPFGKKQLQFPFRFSGWAKFPTLQNAAASQSFLQLRI
jgi:hypothetical protein